MWMVRGDNGRLYSFFLENGVVGVGWRELAEVFDDNPQITRDQLLARYRERHPEVDYDAAVRITLQVWRFAREIAIGDQIVVYSPAHRTYVAGRVQSDAAYHPEWFDCSGILAREVEWAKEFERDALSIAARNALVSPLEVFRVATAAADEIAALSAGNLVLGLEENLIGEDDVVDVFGDIDNQAMERIKDRLAELSTTRLRELVAGVLRVMGYKTQAIEPEAPHEKDIVAIPDGYGHGKRRIVVEIQHREGVVGTERIRGFFNEDDHDQQRGLMIGTAGFALGTRAAAENTPAPLALWTLDDLAREVTERYDTLDDTVRRILALKPIYWPC